MVKDIFTECFLSVLFCTAGILPAYADSSAAEPYKLEDLVNEQYLPQLKTEKKIRLVHNEKDIQFDLLPKSVYAKLAAANRVKKESGYITECLYLIDRNDSNQKNTDNVPVDTSINAIACILRSISKMEGMKYYSNFYKKTMVLYSRTYMIAGPDDDTPVPDQNTGNADGQVSYAYQHDNTFGGCKYMLNYYQSANEMYATFNNLTKMMFGIVNAVNPYQFRVNMLIIDCGQQYLVYISTDVGCPRIEIINSQINYAFNDRLDALHTWFISQF